MEVGIAWEELNSEKLEELNSEKVRRTEFRKVVY
jgi:hypothetical protein